jgi:hypothetical protein
MKKVIGFALILLTIIFFTSCTTQQRVVYRDCDCNTTTSGFGWNTNPYWSWNNPFWGWNNPYWGGWNSWNFYPYRVIPRYYTPNRVQPQQPTRYERRQSIGPRPNRNSNSNFDNTYPYRTPTIPRIEARPSQQNRQPSRIQNNSNRYNQPQQRINQSVPSRNGNSTPSRVQQRTTTPPKTQPQQRTTTPTRRGGSNY